MPEVWRGGERFDNIIEVGEGVDPIDALDNLLPQYADCNLATIEIDGKGHEYLDVDHPSGRYRILIQRPT